MSIIKKVLANVVQSLTDQEKSTARTNIGATYRFDIQFAVDSMVNPTTVTANKTLSEVNLAISNGNIIYPTLTASGGTVADVGVVSGKSGVDVTFTFPSNAGAIAVVMRGGGTIDVVKFEYMTLPCILDSSSMQASEIYTATEAAIVRGVRPVYRAASGSKLVYYDYTGTDSVDGLGAHVFANISHAYGSTSATLSQIYILNDGSVRTQTVVLAS